MNIKRLHNHDTPYYEITNLSNYNELLEWLYKLEETDMSVALNGRLYRFKTVEERIQFVFGFQAAWDLINETYLIMTHGE